MWARARRQRLVVVVKFRCATSNAKAGGECNIAVIGCGALGLTTALLRQRARARVTIYAKDLTSE